MTIHATFNPIGSTNPKDLIDNAQNLDYLILGPALLYADRRGVNRLSWAGIEASFAAAQAQRSNDFNVAQIQRATDFDTAQTLRDANFEAQMSTMTYELPAIPYAGGVTINRVTQVIEKDNEFYRAKPGVVPFVTTGSWPTDLNKLIYIGDAVLRGDLARRDAIFVEDFGAVSGDLTASNGDAFRQAILAATVRKKSRIHGYGNVYAFQNDYWEVPDGFVFEGAGVDAWDLKGSWRPKKMEKGTTLLFCGTPTTRVTVAGVSKMAVAGGVVANDDYATESIPGSQTYELLDYTNGDSTGAAPATPKQLRVAVRLGANSRLENCRVQLNYNGVDGYNSVEMLPDFPEYTTSYKGLGDGYDIGVLSYNAQASGLSGVQVVGYWRMAARAVISSNFGDGKSFGGAVFYDENIFYQGFNGLSVRGTDSHRITALTSTTVEVPWNASHTVPLTGSCYLGGSPYTYTTSVKVGDKLVLSGFTVDPSTKSTVGSKCTFGTNPAFAGSSIRNGFITGLNHSTNLRAYDQTLTTPFATPSKAFEISGWPMRDIEFNNIHFFDTDVIGFVHDALHTGFVSCYAEAQGYSGGIPGAPKGARFIASARPELADAKGAYPMGNARGLYWDSTSEISDGSVDLFPFYPRPATSRFIGTTRYFCPDDCGMAAIGYWASSWDTRRRYDVGSRTFINGLTGDRYFEIVDESLYRYMRINADTKRIGFGTSSPGTSIDYVNGPEASHRMRATDAGIDPSYILGNVVGSWTMRPQQSSFNQYQLRYNNTIMLQLSSTDGTIFSGAHNTASIGTQTNMYKFGYFGTAIGDATHKVPDGYFNRLFTDSGVVSVSDERLKVEVGGIPDAWLDAWAEVDYFQYRLQEQVEERGAGAGILFGVMAQRILSTFNDHGINAFEFGLVTFQQWDESFDEQGNKVQETGDRYGVVYEQAQILESALMRRATRRLEERLATLEEGR